MIVHVQLFAVAKQLAERDEIDVEIAEGAMVADLRGVLQRAVPALKEILPHALFALDAEYASDKTIIKENSEIALIPPVSGG